MARSCDEKDRRTAGVPEALAFLGRLDPDAMLVAAAVERRARSEARRSSPARAAVILSQACLTDAFGDALLCFESYRDGKHPEGKQAPRSLARYCSRWAVTRAMMRYLPASGARQTIVDGVPVPYSRFVAVFCNVTGSLNLGVQPFVKARSRDDFYYAAFATTPKEFIALLPFLIRGRLPMDPKSLLKPISTWGRLAMAMVGKETFPTDPRYVNSTAKRFEIRCSESLYTVDGEILQSDGSPITVTLGTVLKLVVNSTVDLGATLRLAASVVNANKR